MEKNMDKENEIIDGVHELVTDEAQSEVIDEAKKIIEEKKEINNKINELLNLDFTSDINLENFNILYENDKSQVNKEVVNNNEAENVIAELSDTYLDKEYQENLDKIINNMWSLIKKYDANTDLVKNMTEDEKDKIFVLGKYLNRKFGYILNEMLYNLELTEKEYKLIFDFLYSKITYDGTEFFNLKELKERHLDKWRDLYKQFKNGFKTKIDIKSTVMLYHFLNKYTFKGIKEEYYTYGDIMVKIGNMNKLFNAYNVIKERVQTNFISWTGSITTQQTVKEEGIQNTVNE